MLAQKRQSNTTSSTVSPFQMRAGRSNPHYKNSQTLTLDSVPGSNTDTPYSSATASPLGGGPGVATPISEIHRWEFFLMKDFQRLRRRMHNS